MKPPPTFVFLALSQQHYEMDDDYGFLRHIIISSRPPASHDARRYHLFLPLILRLIRQHVLTASLIYMHSLPYVLLMSFIHIFAFFSESSYHGIACFFLRHGLKFFTWLLCRSASDTRIQSLPQ